MAINNCHVLIWFKNCSAKRKKTISEIHLLTLSLNVYIRNYKNDILINSRIDYITKHRECNLQYSFQCYFLEWSLDIQTYISVQVPLSCQMHMLQLFQELHKAVQKFCYGVKLLYQLSS